MKSLEERYKELKHLRKEIKLLEDMKSSYGGYSDTLDKKIESYRTPLLEEYQLLITAINKVPSSLFRLILLERFINCKTWEQVAIATDYDFFHIIKRLRPKALSALQAVLDEDSK